MIQKFTHHPLWLFLTGVLILAASCQGQKEDKESLHIAKEFASLYFNWQYPEAMEYADSSTVQMLRFMASQVNKEDIELLKEKEESSNVVVKEILSETNDSIVVLVHAEDFFQMEAIGKPAVHYEEGDFTFLLTRKAPKSPWRVSSKPQVFSN